MIVDLKREVRNAAQFIADSQKFVYPKAMKEDVEVFADLIDGAHGYAIGWRPEKSKQIVGWLVCDYFDRSWIYVYDIAVLPEWQGAGIGRKMLAWLFERARWSNAIIQAHTRYTSYNLFLSAATPASGYYMAEDRFVAGHYDDVYGKKIGEDAHAITLRPRTP